MPRVTHAREMHRGTDGGAFNADDVPITDIGSFFVATEVEAALAEVSIRAATYTHDQAMPAATWTIAHNLNKHPSVTVVDSGGTVVIGTVLYLSANTVELNFSTAFGGKAYLN